MRVIPAAFVSRCKQDEQGAISVVVALMLVVLLGMAALTIDLGGSLSFRRQMVAGADAAALAAARACANGQSTTAVQAAANTYVAENVPGTTGANQTTFQVVNGATSVCGVLSSPRGSVTVGYQRVRDNVFAPILGQNSAIVGATARASWGPLGEGIPPPVLLAQNPFTDCFPDGIRQTTPVSIETEIRCVVWFDNQQMANGQWGFMDLDTWGISSGTNCQGTASPPELSNWIKNGYPTSLNVDPVPTYVCMAPGTNPQGWVQDLHGERYQPGGKTGIRLFPIVDSIISGPGHPKAGVIAFAPVRIRFADWGNGVKPTGGDAYTCGSDNVSFTTGQTRSLFGLPVASGSCPTSASQVQTMGIPTLTYRPQGHTGASLVAVPCVSPGVPAGCHYTHDALNHTVTWLAAAQNRVKITFTWTTPLVGGTCTAEAPGAPNPPPPGNSSSIACVVISWPGPQTFSGYIGNTGDFGARAVDLTG